MSVGFLNGLEGMLCSLIAFEHTIIDIDKVYVVAGRPVTSRLLLIFFNSCRTSITHSYSEIDTRLPLQACSSFINTLEYVRFR